MTCPSSRAVFACCVACVLFTDAHCVFAAGKLTAYQTRYYTIHTDLPQEDIREAEIRVSRMAEEYYRRTRNFNGSIEKRLPFYIFSSKDDYYAAGGLPGSIGVFGRDRLMAAVSSTPEYLWKTLQHEGFHQFVHSVIGGSIPVWLNEGMAEYFGEAVFTGTGFVTGVVPPRRAERVKAMIAAGQYTPFPELMTMSHQTWNGAMATANYDQAWSMVHFLAHASDGRYEATLNSFLHETSRGRRWDHAWADTFGRNSIGAFEEQWRTYWARLPVDASRARYAEAAVVTITNFLARAVNNGQTFDDLSAFESAAKNGSLTIRENEWLPPRMLIDTLDRFSSIGTWTLTPGTGRRHPYVTCTLPDGTTLTGTFTIRKGKVRQVEARVTPSHKAQGR